MRMGYCQGCLEKQHQINLLKEEIVALKARLRYQERAVKEGAFGSATPSSKVPVKANSLPERQERRGGAPQGHAGRGREVIEPDQADRVERVPGPEVCPDCGTRLQAVGTRSRAVIELVPARVERVIYRLPRQSCPKCGREARARAPGVLAKCLYSNGLLAYIAEQHYLWERPLCQLARQIGRPHGSLLAALHRVAGLLEEIPKKLVAEYRRAQVKHADETGWRTDGQNGYAWLFATPRLSIFRLRNSRAAQVAAEVLGDRQLPGTLVVDRYGAYNQAPCALQYCYAHLLRDTHDAAQQFPENPEVRAFVQALAPALAKAMGLRSRPISDAQFRRRATRLKNQIRATVNRPASHPAIWKIQGIFRDHADRVYHWAADRRIPADNNLAERDLRPLVIARKISFGSQSPKGARTRETLMSVMQTLRKRGANVPQVLKSCLDHLVEKPDADPYVLLFAPDSS